MSTSTSRHLAILLDTPELPAVVPTLAPETLHRVITHCGLEACTPLVALATPAQLSAVFDLDLWAQPEPGRDVRFDVARFGEWLEVLTDADTALAARTLAAMDRRVAVDALSRFVRVCDLGAIGTFMNLDGDLVTPAIGNGAWIACDIGAYHVRARRPEAWDAIVMLLMALEDGHPVVFDALMRGCRRLSNSLAEQDVDAPPSAHGQWQAEAAIERGTRQTTRGFVPAAEARSFLQAARHSALTVEVMRPRHPVVDEHLQSPVEAEDATPAPNRAQPDHREAVRALASLLQAAEAGAAPPPRPLLTGRTSSANAGPVRVMATLATLIDEEPALHHMRVRELAFLANALVSGCSFQAQSFTPGDASAAVAATCNLGLEWVASSKGSARHRADTATDFITAFEIGWRLLHERVGMFTLTGLRHTLAHVRGGDTRTHADLLHLRHAVTRHLGAGTPWRVHDALDVLGVLDTIAWKGLLGLLDECPTIPAVVDATIDGRREPVSATDFAFISTMQQVRRAQDFVERLPELLGG